MTPIKVGMSPCGRYEHWVYPTAWAIVEDEVTGELREATEQELVDLGLRYDLR